MANRTEQSTASARVDLWTWAVRLYPTRSAAAAACRGGHVKVNGANAKPAHPVRAGDVVRALTKGGERVVVVVQPVVRRTSAAIAVQNYEDRTPPPAPREERAQQVARDPGAGRPTKRDRRRLDRLTGRS